jgi:hypothetical protein
MDKFNELMKGDGNLLRRLHWVMVINMINFGVFLVASIIVYSKYNVYGPATALLFNTGLMELLFYYFGRKISNSKVWGLIGLVVGLVYLLAITAISLFVILDRGDVFRYFDSRGFQEDSEGLRNLLTGGLYMVTCVYLFFFISIKVSWLEVESFHVLFTHLSPVVVRREREPPAGQAEDGRGGVEPAVGAQEEVGSGLAGPTRGLSPKNPPRTRRRRNGPSPRRKRGGKLRKKMKTGKV